MGSTYSCVVDRPPLFAYQAMLWAKTLVGLSGIAPEQVYIHFIEGCDSRVIDLFRGVGINAISVPPFDARHPYCNKLQQLASAPLQDADFVVLCDCDLAFVEPFGEIVRGDRVRAKIVDTAGLTELWPTIFDRAGFGGKPLAARTSQSGLSTDVNYCNGGLYVIPKNLMKDLAVTWPKWARWLLDRPDLLPDTPQFVDQVAFALAMAELGQEVDHLTPEYNCPTHAGNELGSLNGPPKILHYHRMLDRNGLLKSTGNELVDRQVGRVNKFLAEGSTLGIDRAALWDVRYLTAPAPGSGPYSRGRPLALKARVLSEEVRAIKPDTVLDIGCGDLELTRGLRVPRYTGVDLSEEALAVARAKRPDLRFISGNALELDLAPSDLVICADLLPYVQDQGQYERLVGRLTSLTRQELLVTGLGADPVAEENLMFYHEPIRKTLSRLASGHIRVAGRYDAIEVLIWSRRPMNPLSLNRMRARLGTWLRG